jgi:hypothetical protein
VHDAVLSDLSNTGAHTESARLRGSGIGQLREELCQAHEFEDERQKVPVGECGFTFTNIWRGRTSRRKPSRLSANRMQGSLFGPYTPLQQLDILADYGTKSYIVGSTNSLLLQQKDRYSDILVNLDDITINITSPSLRQALALSAADRRWIDWITSCVNETWDETNPSRPKTMRYQGSEEFIRLQFEEYLVSLISSVKCHNYMTKHASNPRVMLPQVDGDPATDFSLDWIDAWSRSENYRIWDKNTDSHLFDFVEPRHPFPGGLTIEDVQRRLSEQVKEFHLDERFAVGKEVLGRNFQAGREKASTVFNKLYADMEALRESQRRKHEEQRREAEKNGQHSPGFAPDLNGARHTVQSVGSKAGAYIGSWGTWMGEKRKVGWGRSSTASQAATLKKENMHLPMRSVRNEKAPNVVTPIKSDNTARPQTQESYEENLFDAEAAGHAQHANEVKKVDAHPHHATPSKFHEDIDDEPPKAVHEAAAEAVSESSQKWEETAAPKVDAGEKSNAVAEAVEAATATPISP